MTDTTSTSLATSNGHARDDAFADPYADAAAATSNALTLHASGLREVLEWEQTLVQRLEAHLRDARERERRVRRALDVLEGTSAPVGRPPGPAKERSARSRHARGTHVGRVNTERVLAALLDADTPQKVGELEPVVGLSGKTVLRALNVLRDEERVRVASVNAHGGVSWAAMPDAEVRDVERRVAATPPTRQERAERDRRIVEYGREHDEFRASELAAMLDVSASGIGPVTARLVREGVLEHVRDIPRPDNPQQSVAVYRLGESARHGA